MALLIRSYPPRNAALRSVGFMTHGHVTLQRPSKRAERRCPSSPIRAWRSPARARIALARPPPPPPAPVLGGPLIPAAVLVAALLAFGMGWTAATARQQRLRKQWVPALELPALKAGELPSSEASGLKADSSDSDPEGYDFHVSSSDNALWLNTSLFPSAWRLFRKNTASLIKDVLQPVLDDVDRPDWIHRVEMTNLRLGDRSPLVRKIRRLPSRARSDLQYRFNCRLLGDLTIDLNVYVPIPLLNSQYIVVPVTVSDLDIDAKVWIGFQMFPNPPWVRFIQWALEKLPSVKMSIRIANVIPVTAIPVLSAILSRIFTKSIPKEFLFPKTQLLDLTDGKKPRPMDVVPAPRGDAEDVEGFVNESYLRQQNPALWALFDSMDVNGDGFLSPDELVIGLSEDWGFSSTSESDKLAMFNVVDEDNDNRVTFEEFVKIWPDLRSVFVPRRYRGVVSGVLQKADGLPCPQWGYSDPYVVLRTERLSRASKTDRQTGKRAKAPGFAVWTEGWELEVEDPETAWIEVEVHEGSRFAFHTSTAPQIPAASQNFGAATPSAPSEPTQPRTPVAGPSSGPEPSDSQPVAYRGRILGVGRLRVKKLGDGTPCKTWVHLNPCGRILLDLSYAEYVDARPV